MVKNYLLDTNILLTNPNSIFGFDDNHVVISGTTLQELDKFKALGGENGFAARECCRILDSLRENGDFKDGILLENGGILYIEASGSTSGKLPEGFSYESPDNRIISTGLFLQEKDKDTPVILVTNDISMRVNASICGLQVESYKNDEADNNYLGYREIETEKEVIDLLYKEERVELKEIKDKLQNVSRKNSLVENEYLILKSGSQSVLCRVSKNSIIKIKEHTLFGSIQAKNVAQKFAIDALLAPADEIPLVILIGPAGTAKTFLSLAAGLTQTKLGRGDDGAYNRILISRPNVITEE